MIDGETRHVLPLASHGGVSVTVPYLERFTRSPERLCRYPPEYHPGITGVSTGYHPDITQQYTPGVSLCVWVKSSLITGPSHIFALLWGFLESSGLLLGMEGRLSDWWTRILKIDMYVAWSRVVETIIVMNDVLCSCSGHWKASIWCLCTRCLSKSRPSTSLYCS
jgi:hypothetical protein